MAAKTSESQYIFKLQVYPLCKEKNMNVKSMSYTGKVLWTVWELDIEDYEILFNFTSTKCFTP